jgi:predicted RNA methylase
MEILGRKLSYDFSKKMMSYARSFVAWLIEQGVVQSFESLHEWQQPVGEAVHFLRSLSNPVELIADLCVGTGMVAAATALVGRGRRFVGCELDPALVAAAQSLVAEVLRTSSC